MVNPGNRRLRKTVIVEVRRRGKEANDLHFFSAGIVQHVDLTLRKQHRGARPDQSYFAVDHHAARARQM